MNTLRRTSMVLFTLRSFWSDLGSRFSRAAILRQSIDTRLFYDFNVEVSQVYGYECNVSVSTGASTEMGRQTHALGLQIPEGLFSLVPFSVTTLCKAASREDPDTKRLFQRFCMCKRTGTRGRKPQKLLGVNKRTNSMHQSAVLVLVRLSPPRY